MVGVDGFEDHAPNFSRPVRPNQGTEKPANQEKIVKKKIVNIGVVGCGYWGPNLIRNFRALQDCRMRVICDQDVNRLKQLKTLYPEVQTETDFGKVLADKHIDAIVI